MVTVTQSKRAMAIPKRSNRIAYLAKVDWTVDPKTGTSNSSAMFEKIVDDVASIVSNVRLGGDPKSTARYIVAHLAHGFGMKPTKNC